MRLQGKRVVITAAASGMGRAGCELFAREGAKVAAIDINEAQLRSVTEAINASGGDAAGFVADLSNADDTVRGVDQAIAWLGGLDVLWNHAGIPGQGAIEDIDIDHYRRTMDINLTAGLLAVGRALPHLRNSGGGSIVFTASIAGLVASALSPIYSAAKFAVVGLSKGLAVRLAPERIRVNAICPGPIETAMFPDFMNSDSRFSQVDNRARVIASVPMGRIGEAIEAAHAALWLASDESSYVTGITVPVDGGLTAR